MDDGEAMHRSWGEAVFKDLLCRDLPVVRSQDAISFVRENSDIPFRQGISCMQCHSSMDGLAKAVSNTSIVRADTTGDRNIGLSTAHVYKHETTEAPLWEEVDRDPDHYRRPLSIHFYFRSAVDGRLHDRKFSSLDELSRYIVNNVEDFYTCAAKRYFNFFTGINVPLFDQGDLSNRIDLSPEMEYYHSMVLELGKDFRQDRNLYTLIEKIIASDTFLSPGQQ